MPQQPETTKPELVYPHALGDRAAELPVKLPPTVCLAHVPGAQGDNNLTGRNNVEILPDSSLPALLISFVYLDAFVTNQRKYHYRNWMMDSGAYSAYNIGTTIDINKYIDTCLRLGERDKTLTEIIALDVIGSGEGSLKNATYMKAQGVTDCIPVHHIGDDWDILKEYCKNHPKVGLSCRFGEPINKSLKYYDQCFARAWPKKFHSFGWIDEKMLMKYPFHSSDSSSWEVGPCAFANWKMFGKMSVRGSTQNLRVQVDWYLALEERLRQRWKKEMLVLNGLDDHSLRMVVGSGRSVNKVGFKALGKQPGEK